MAEKSLEPGAHLAAALGERGAPLEAAEARLVLDTLLRLFELGALVFDDAPVAVHQPPARRIVGGCGQVPATPASGLPLSNRQPSKYEESGEG